MPTRDPRIDAYIKKAQPFARPILLHLRAVVHAACPDVEETIKWGFPHFDYRGGMMCAMASFKAHCVFGFWNGSLLLKGDSRNADAMGDFGRIIALSELPSKARIAALVKQAMKLNEAGVKRVARKARVPKKPLRLPADLAAALANTPAASTAFKAFSPSARREYIEWITEAKSPATRERRLVTAVGWIAEGKRRNWKYEKG